MVNHHIGDGDGGDDDDGDDGGDDDGDGLIGWEASLL